MTEKGIQKLLQEKWPDCEFVAEGGNSWVYLINVSDKFYAIKVFRRFGDNQRYLRFKNEVTTMQSFNGTSGIVILNTKIQNFPSKSLPKEMIKSPNDIAYFAMDYHKFSLREKLNDYSTDDGTRAVDAIIEIADIINTLHQNNYAHRDLKPDNILIDSNNNLLVSDYGLSIDLADIHIEELRLTKEGEQIGSLTYRAPELLRGRLDDSDHKPCDIFALGRMLWALIYGEEPHGITDHEFLEKSVNNLNRSIKNPAMLDSIIRSAISIDPKFRTKIEDFIEALNTWKMERETGSYEELTQKILNNQISISKGAHFKKVAGIKEKHNETMLYLREQLNELTKGWHKMSDDYREKMIYGYRFEIQTVTNYSPDFHPDELGFDKFDWELSGLLVRLMIGDIDVSPRIQLALYIQLDTENWEGQKFLVLGGYIPKDSDVSKGNSENSEIVTDCEIHNFDYREDDIKDKMLVELTKGFEQLDKVLHEEIKK